MAPIENNGYLGQEIHAWIRKYRLEYDKWFALVNDLNQFCHSEMLKLEIGCNDTRSILITSAFIRSLSAFQGVIILGERGMIYEAATIARAQLETMFVVCAAVEDSEFSEQYIRSLEANKLDHMKKLLQSSSIIQDVVADKISWNDVEKLKTRLKADGIKEIRMADIAKKSKLLDWYNVNYSFLSLHAAHPTAASLDKHCMPDPSGNVDSFVWGPDAKGIDHIFSISIESLLMVLSKMSAHLNKPWQQALDEYHDRFDKLREAMSDFDISHF